jgi:uncharacterized protein involved in type VI secretion and phage assembly
MPRTDEQVYVKVNGHPVDLADAKLISVTIEQSLTLPDAFSITLASGLEWLKEDVFAMGADVKIELAQDKSSRRTMISGEVTGLMPSLLPENQVQLCVRGYDKSHRLLRGRKTRPFVQMTDSDIAEEIAQKAGLSTDVTSTSEVHAYVLQYQQTDLEFLQARSSALGFKVGVNEDTLYLKPLGDAAQEVEMRWGEGLESFDVSRTTMGQATEVLVHGWDPQAKQAVVGRRNSSDTAPQTRRPDSGGDVVKRAFAIDAPMTVVRADIDSQAGAERLAQVILDEMNGCFTTAHGTAAGDPALRAGVIVKIAGAGVFDGKYRLSSVQHVFDRNGYRCLFSVEGARATPSIPSAAPAKPPTDANLTFISGIVTNNKDPAELGRVKVKMPALMADLESGWCRMVTPMAGDGRGFFTLPEVGDEVLVAFEAGDVSRPVVLGALWNGQDRLPENAARAVSEGGQVDHRLWKSRSGHMLLFDDSDGKEQVVIQDKEGNQVVIESANNTLKVVMKERGNVEVEAPGNITLKAGANVKIEAGGQLNIEAGGALALKGSVVNIN